MRLPSNAENQKGNILDILINMHAKKTTLDKKAKASKKSSTHVSSVTVKEYSLNIPSSPSKLDVICLGRAGADLYALESNTDMEDVTQFKKYVGGSAANIAVALAKLGAKTGFISCVSKDALGKYVCKYLKSTGINTDGIKILDDGSRTSLAITEMKPQSPEVIIYRNMASDLQLCSSNIDPNYIKKARALIVTGTALSASPSREATLMAMKYAHTYNVFTVLDLDYRAYSWENMETAALYYQIGASMSDMIIGNKEEFAVMENLYNSKEKKSNTQIAHKFLNQKTKVIIIKAGEKGSEVFCENGDRFKQKIFPVQVQKPFGAGDSFAGALMFSLLNKYSLRKSVIMGSAAAAINVSKDSCTEAMPSLSELLNFIKKREK